MSASEDRTIQRVREGDTEAFSQLVASYERAVYAIAMATTGDVPEAEDLTQTSFVEAFAGIGKLRDGRRFAPWLYAITRNRCRDWLRKRPRRPILIDDPSKLHNTNPPESRSNPEHQVIVAERDDAIRAAVESLPVPYRAVILLRYAGDLSYEEIGSTLGLSVPAAKVRCHRARKLLRESLKDQLDDSDNGL